jgi:hypothetical protein
MMFSGVEILKLQFSRAVDQTFESFLDSWSMPSKGEEVAFENWAGNGQFSTEIPVSVSN